MDNIVTNFDLTEEQEMIRDTVRRFANEVVAPGAAAADENKQLNMDEGEFTQAKNLEEAQQRTILDNISRGIVSNAGACKFVLS